MTAVVRAARLLDGTGGAPLYDSSVVAESGTIVAVLAGDPSQGAVAGLATRSDLLSIEGAVHDLGARRAVRAVAQGSRWHMPSVSLALLAGVRS